MDGTQQPELAQTRAAVMADMQAAVIELRAVLDAEREALDHLDSLALDAATSAKAELLQRLETLQAERCQLDDMAAPREAAGVWQSIAGNWKLAGTSTKSTAASSSIDCWTCAGRSGCCAGPAKDRLSCMDRAAMHVHMRCRVRYRRPESRSPQTCLQQPSPSRATALRASRSKSCLSSACRSWTATRN
jgi:hypothetical protein